jgi:hypothetical protein
MPALADVPRALPRSGLVQYTFCDEKRFYDVAHLFSPIGATSAEDLRCADHMRDESASPRFATVPARWLAMMIAVYRTG